MLSRLLHSAKSYISPADSPASSSATTSTPTSSKQSKAVGKFITSTPQWNKAEALKAAEKVAKPSQTPRKRTTRIHSPDTMVTTRQSKDAVAAEELTDENSINIYVPGTSSVQGKGKKRGVVAEDGNGVGTPIRPAKKRKVSPLAEEGPVVKSSSRLVVEIPVSKEIAGEAKVVEKKVDGIEKPKVHKKFGSDDEGEADEEVLTTTRGSPVIEDVEEEEESSDDEAPEEVGAQSAALKAKVQAESANIAIKSQRKKRKERTTQIQASKAKKSAPSEVEKSLAEILSEDEDEEDEDAEEDSSSSSDSGDEDDLPTISKSKRLIFERTQPKDRKVGSTTYRVTKGPARDLAPKAEKRARNTKEDWLKGRNGKAGVGANRKPLKKGFF